MAKKELKEGKIYCAKCNLEMREVLLPKYEYAEGLPLHNVSAYRCHKCGNTFFTELQAKEMESRTNELRICVRIRKKSYNQWQELSSNHTA